MLPLALASSGGSPSGVQVTSCPLRCFLVPGTVCVCVCGGGGGLLPITYRTDGTLQLVYP